MNVTMKLAGIAALAVVLGLPAIPAAQAQGVFIGAGVAPSYGYAPGYGYGYPQPGFDAYAAEPGPGVVYGPGPEPYGPTSAVPYENYSSRNEHLCTISPGSPNYEPCMNSEGN